MKVYVVVRGDNGEGQSIEGVFASRKSARKHALACRHFGPWVEGSDAIQTIWFSGCDWVAVRPYKVHQ